MEEKLDNSRKANELLNKTNNELRWEKRTMYSKAVNDIISKFNLGDEFIPVQKVKDKIEELDKRIDFLNTELTKCYIEREKLGTETDIDNNETYIFYMEEEKNFREKQKEILQELLGEE